MQIKPLGASLIGQAGLLGCLLAVFVSSPAAAQGEPFALDHFRASETTEDSFQISRPDSMGEGIKFSAQLHVDYANDPLVWESSQGTADTETFRVVSNHLVGNVGLSLGLFDRLIIFAGLPLNLWMTGEEDGVARGDGTIPMRPAGLQETPDEFGLGDVYLGARIRLFGEYEDTVGLALQLTGTFPTGGVTGDHDFRGDDFLGIHPELLFEVRPGDKVRITANAGFRIRTNRDFGAGTGRVVAGDEITWALGLSAPIIGSRFANETRLDVHVQAFGSIGTQVWDADAAEAAGGIGGREESPIEVLGGLKLHTEPGFVIGAAGGLGLQRGLGAPDFRIIGTLGFATPREFDVVADPECDDEDGDGLCGAEDQCPAQPEDFDGDADDDGCPDVEDDADGDGITDADDSCPSDPEDRDAFEDEDGCPDTDNDGDGVLDVNDGEKQGNGFGACLNDPEDVDQWEDEDGCPDPDNDGDGLLDSADACPNESGPAENRGCPDADRDGDGVVDRLDNCPDEPGTAENFGCKKKQKVRISDGKLEILDKVYFKTNKDRILRRSHALLKNVAQVVNSHPEINLVRVEGHTDARGDHDYNVDLSERRAKAVVKFLTKRGGVDASRLEARGYGPDRPIVASASSKEEHAQNRRVEFNIPGIAQSNNGPGSDSID